MLLNVERKYLSISIQSTELYKTRDVDQGTRKTNAKAGGETQRKLRLTQPVACVDTERKLGGEERSTSCQLPLNRLCFSLNGRIPAS